MHLGVRSPGPAYLRCGPNSPLSILERPTTLKSVAKRRLDQLLVDRGLVESRTREQALVLAGCVFSGERRLDKPGTPVPGDVPLEVRGQDHPWEIGRAHV